MSTPKNFRRKTFWCLFAIPIILGSLLWQFGAGAQSRRPAAGSKVQEGGSKTAKRKIDGTAAQNAIQSAKSRVDQAIAAEKANPTKQTALDVDAAWVELNNANAARVAEIRMSLRSLESATKTAATAAQMEALEAEMRQIDAPLGPMPTVNPETEPNVTSATANYWSTSVQPARPTKTVMPCWATKTLRLNLRMDLPGRPGCDITSRPLAVSPRSVRPHRRLSMSGSATATTPACTRS